MQQIRAKFNGKCASTGNPIYKGDIVWYDPITRKVYAQVDDDAKTYRRDNVNNSNSFINERHYHV